MASAKGPGNIIRFPGAGPDLSVTIGGLRFPNPVIAASGTFGYGSEYAGLIDVSRLGGIVSKGLTLEPRPGNKGIRLWETASGLLNSIGLENPGIAAFIGQELPRLKTLGPVIIANLAGSTVEEYTEGARLLGDSAVDMIELNISCPNIKAGGMAFGLDPAMAASLTGAVKKAAGKPLVVKLSPNAPDLAALGRACAAAGADGLSLVNSFKALAIDINQRKPLFDHITAGLSGPAIKPIALRMVWELREAVSLPLIGLGGIASTSDALEFLMAGAAAVQVGTASFVHPGTMPDIIDGLELYMRKNKILTLGGLDIR
ncbi:MAG: dihydroorotate dehydrogenase, partial [Treponema sp.]|nr:dihydroorotate dehydrogenase [Treponema sp.]